MSDFLSDLSNLIRELSEEQCLAAAESPATAEEKIDRYEGILRDWRKMLYGQMGVLKTLLVFEAEESYATIVDEQRIENDAQRTLRILSQLSNQDEERLEHEQLLTVSEALGDQIQERWQELERRRLSLLSRANSLMEYYTHNSPVTPLEGGVVTPGDIKLQRKRIQSIIDAAQTSLATTHREEISARMTEMDALMPEVRETKRELMGWETRNAELEKAVYEMFGIVASDIDPKTKMPPPVKDDWLLNEEEYVGTLMQNEIHALSMIFTIDFVREDTEHWMVHVTPVRPHSPFQTHPLRNVLGEAS
eukprot:Blabericola_migrator_1__3524@NODE_2045_length_3373_cov_106_102541_g172_i1_p3_GENE_NODE_2045_length_3373_cov_106_102541_g172_i1NODE_2045_length_3373_cov_106_102541_g172_i1_p3_ORF_typecomplete_len306_score73_70DUF1978/PF09321_10/91DUF1978/PF09321_10/1_3e03DUF1978/PF09321_10/0_14Uds1/PF15456_6/2_6e03Uds1/PF15456_6/0_41Atg14/PF10186_9/3Spc7/PF08317_11/9_6Spc7/PF08317_11/2_4SSFA2_C/PF14723_6/26SSFA2_C/PF14723_6/1_3e02Fungal_trans_2/PF11951_8/40_NODE_2045_length_3373_cov_106_102541_g172_i124143331